MKHNYNKISKQKGVAVITAMLLVSLATFITVSMWEQNEINAHRNANILNFERTYLYLVGAEDWAIHVLARDIRDNNTDSLDDDWAQLLPAIPVENEDTDFIAGHIKDLQGRFNLNNLADADETSVEYQRFKRLLENNEIPPTLVNAVLDWVDEDTETRFPDGAEDSEYLNKEIPYRPANRMMQSSTELLRVEGFTYEYYERIEDYVVALPVPTSINLNTAPPQVLQMVVEGLSETEAEQIIDARENAPFTSIDDFTELSQLEGKNFVSTGVSVNSSYFLLTATAEIGTAKGKLYSIIERNDDKNIKVIMRSQGGI